MQKKKFPWTIHTPFQFFFYTELLLGKLNYLLAKSSPEMIDGSFNWAKATWKVIRPYEVGNKIIKVLMKVTRELIFLQTDVTLT